MNEMYSVRPEQLAVRAKRELDRTLETLLSEERRHGLSNDREKYYDKSLKENLTEEYWDMAWLIQFNGHVPKEWAVWHKVINDLEQAGIKNTQMNSIFIDAAVTHSDHRVAFSAGWNQKLTPIQLGTLLKRADFNESEGNRMDAIKVLTVQEVKFGLTNLEKDFAEMLPFTSAFDPFAFLYREDLPPIASRVVQIK